MSKNPMSERVLLRAFIKVLAEFDVRHKDIEKHIRRKKHIRLWALTDTGEKKIYIYKHDDYLSKFTSVIHEMLHAAFPDKDEEEVIELTDEIAEMLW